LNTVIYNLRKLWPLVFTFAVQAENAVSIPVVPEELIYPLDEIPAPPKASPITPNQESPKERVAYDHPLADIIENVTKNSPKLQSARLQIAIEKSRSQQSQAQRLPSLDLIGTLDVTRERYDRIENSGHPTKFGAVLSQPLFNRPADLSHQISRFDESLAEIQSNLQDQDIIQELCRRYLDLYRFSRLAEFSRNNSGLAHEHLRSTTIRQEKGELTITDTNQALVRYKTAQAINEQSKAQLEIAKHRFTELTQTTPPSKLLLFDLSLSEEEMNSFLETGRLRQQPELQLLTTRIQKEKKQQSLTYSRYLPRLDLSLEQYRTWNNNANFVGNPYDETIVSLNFNWNLFNGGRTLGQQAESSLITQQLEFNYAQQTLESRRHIQEAILNVQVANSISNTYKEAVEAAKKALVGIQQEFLVGTRTALDAFDAQNELFVSQSRWLNAKVDRLLSSVLLLKTIGLLYPEIFCPRLGIDNSLDG
jgi:outer membrane protein TolC